MARGKSQGTFDHGSGLRGAEPMELGGVGGYSRVVRKEIYLPESLDQNSIYLEIIYPENTNENNTKQNFTNLENTNKNCK